MAAAQITQNERIRAAILANFAHEAFCLSYHWVYDQKEIKRPIAPELHEPASKFHAKAGKVKGEYTHIGDKALILLRSLDEKKTFDLDDFAHRYQKLFGEGYKGWTTHACTAVLAKLKEGVPPAQVKHVSDDGSTLARISPLLIVYRDEASFSKVVREYISFSHNHPLVLDSVDFFGAAFFAVLGGQTPIEAIKSTVEREPFSRNETLVNLVQKGLESKEQPTNQTITAFGASCSIDQIVPGAVHVIAKYENDITAAFEANVGAGGDSGGRGGPVAMLLGAYHGLKKLPPYTYAPIHTPEVEQILNKHL